MSGLQRMWFVPGDGIDRSIISSNIQRYLGNDATVRPGLGTEHPHQDLPGFWIKAERTLTTSQLEDLRRDTAKHRQAQDRQPQRNRPPTHDYQVPRPPTNQGYPPRPQYGGDSPGDMDVDYPGPRRQPEYGGRGADPRYDMDYAPAVPRYEEPPYDRYGDRRQPPGMNHYDMNRPYPPPVGPDAGMYGAGRPSYDGRPDYAGDVPPYRGPGVGNPYDGDRRAQNRPTGPGAPPPLSGYNAGPPNAGYTARPHDDGYYPPVGSYGGPMNPPVQPPYGANPYSSGPAGPMARDEDRRRPPVINSDYSPDSRGSTEGTIGRDPARYAYPSPPVTVVASRDNALNTNHSRPYIPPTAASTSTAGYGYDNARPGPPLPVPGITSGPAPFGSAALAGAEQRYRPSQRLTDDMDVEPPRQKTRMR